MAKQTINIGTNPADGTGDSLRTALSKCNANFAELYEGAAEAVSQQELDDHLADTHNPHSVTKSQVGLGSVPNVDATLRANHTGSQAIATVSGLQEALDAKADGADLETKADLVGGKVPSSQLPSIALVAFKGAVNGQSAMLALRGDPGDFCFRSDQGLAYFITSGDGSELSHWQSVATPGNIGVSSVNGHIGVVVLDKADIGLPSVDDTSDLEKPLSDAAVAALALKPGLVTEPFTAAVYSLTISATQGSELPGVFVDLPAPEGIQRIWFDVDASSTAPDAPGGGGVLQRIPITTLNTAAEIAAALDGAVGPLFSASASGTVVTFTAASAGETSGSPAVSDGSFLSLSTTTPGANVTRLEAVNGSLITNLNGAAISPGSLSASQLADLVTPYNLDMRDGSNITSGTINIDRLPAILGSKITDGTITSAKIADGTIVNADISASAAIAASKISGLAASATVNTQNADNITSGTLNIARIADGTVTAAKLANSAVDLASAKVTGVLAAANGGTGGAAALDRFRCNPTDWNFTWGSVSTTGTSGSGGNTPSNHSINVTSGATSGSRGMAIVPTTNLSTFLGAAGGDYRFCDFSKRVTVGFALAMIQATSAGATWVKIGQSASTAGDLAARGVQIKISNLTLTAACHNGSALTGSSTLATLTTSTGHYLILQSDGAGSVGVYLNGTLVATLSGGPTSATTSQFEIAVECTNGADSATQRVQVSPVKVCVAA